MRRSLLPHSILSRLQRLRRVALAVTAVSALTVFGAAGTGVARTVHAASGTVHVVEHAITDAEAPSSGGART